MGAGRGLVPLPALPRRGGREVAAGAVSVEAEAGSRRDGRPGLAPSRPASGIAVSRVGVCPSCERCRAFVELAAQVAYRDILILRPCQRCGHPFLYCHSREPGRLYCDECRKPAQKERERGARKRYRGTEYGRVHFPDCIAKPWVLWVFSEGQILVPTSS
jgi:hypothetical protein